MNLVIFGLAGRTGLVRGLAGPVRRPSVTRHGSVSGPGLETVRTRMVRMLRTRLTEYNRGLHGYCAAGDIAVSAVLGKLNTTRTSFFCYFVFC